MQLLKKLYDVFSSGLAVTTGLVVMRVSAFLIGVIVARAAGASVYGEYTLFVTVFILTSEIPRAFDTAFIRFANNPNSKETDNKYLFYALFCKVIYMFASLLTAFLLSKTSVVNILPDPHTGKLLFWSIMAGCLNSIYMLHVSSYQQKHEFFKVGIMLPIVNVSVLAVIYGYTTIYEGVEIGDVLVVYTGVTAVYSVVAIITIINTKNIMFINTLSSFRSYTKVALILLLSSSINLLAGRLDVFYLAHYLNFTQLGYYGVALRISVIVAIMTAVMSTVMLPRASAAMNAKHDFTNYIKMAIRYGALQALLGCILIIASGYIVLFLFGSEYLSSIEVTRILILQVVLTGFSIPFQLLIQCGPHPKNMIYVAVTRMLVGVIVMSILIPLWGLKGAAWGLFLVTFFVFLMIVYLTFKDRPVAA